MSIPPVPAGARALDDYTDGELRTLLADVGKAIAARVRAGEPADAVRPRFHNPGDRSQTWSGRGRQPRWVTEALAAGRTLDDLAS